MLGRHVRQLRIARARGCQPVPAEHRHGGRPPLVDGSAVSLRLSRIHACGVSQQKNVQAELVPSRWNKSGGPRDVYWVGASTGASTALCMPRSAAGNAGGAWFERSGERHGASGLAECAMGRLHTHPSCCLAAAGSGTACTAIVVAMPRCLRCLGEAAEFFFFSRTFLKPSTRSQCNRSYSLLRVSGSM